MNYLGIFWVQNEIQWIRSNLVFKWCACWSGSDKKVLNSVRNCMESSIIVNSRQAKVTDGWVVRAGVSEMYCPDLEAVSSNPGQAELGVRSTSVLSRRPTWTKNTSTVEKKRWLFIINQLHIIIYWMLDYDIEVAYSGVLSDLIWHRNYHFLKSINHGMKPYKFLSRKPLK